MIRQQLDALALSECPVWAFDDEHERYCSVDSYEPLPDDRGTLFLAATFATPECVRLSGYVCGLASIYSIRIFLGDDNFGFNRSLPGRARSELERLRATLGRTSTRVFPLTYETQFHFLGEPLICGTFSPFE